MKRFAYLAANSLEACARALKERPSALAKAGGTDLLDLLKKRILLPDEVVQLPRSGGGGEPGRIPASATLSEVAGSDWLRREAPAVALAAAAAATPQIRNAGTLGGNLCQFTRCWYFRNPAFSCFKRGTGECSAAAEGGLNRYHAIYPHDNCMSAHPSNLAPALIAVGARVECIHPDGNRTLDLELLYDEGPSGRLSDTTLRKGELIASVTIPPSASARRSTYLEFRERQSFDFALASVAVALEIAGGVVQRARIVCGAVSPIPYRARAVESILAGKPLDPAAGARAVVADALPTGQNRFKVRVLEELVRRALEELGS